MVHAFSEMGLVSDAELVEGLERLVKADRALNAKLLVHLGEVEARGLYRERAFGSMFDYCTGALGMSEAEAYLRLLAARVGRRFPLVLERFSAGDVTLTGIKLLSPHLRAENHVQLLDRVRGMSKREIEVLVAELAPKPDVPARMRRLPQAQGRNKSNASATGGVTACSAAASTAEANNTATVCSTASTPAQANKVATAHAELTHVAANNIVTSEASCAANDAATSTVACDAARKSTTLVTSMQSSAATRGALSAQVPAERGASVVAPTTFALQSPRPRATLEPLSPGRFELRLTVGQETRDALKQLVELLRHQNPGGDMTCIVERALCELLEREMKRRFGLTDAKRPRGTSKPASAAGPVEPRVENEASPASEPASLAKPNKMKAERPDVDAKTTSTQACAAKSRHIPRAIRREVHMRDNGQCTFMGSDGRRCTERGFLEVHHHNTTFARGGAATADNLRLACRTHNRLWAEQDYGREFMQEKLREAAAPS